MYSELLASLNKTNKKWYYISVKSWDSSVGIVISYGLDGV
jgi:hypothetical protein